MFEEILLKSLIYDGTFFNKCFNLLKAEYFKNTGNSEAFKLLKGYYAQYKERPSEIALVTMVKDVPNEETRKAIIESLKTVAKTDQNTNTNFMVNETVKFVKDSIYYKGLEIGADGLMNKDEAKMKKAQSLFEEMAKVQVDSNLGLDFDNVEEQIAYYSKREYGIKTQHKSLNKRLGSGFLPGTLNIILAGQGVGKSLLMCDLISGMLQSGKNILMVSLEMSENEMLKRIQANVFDIGVNTFRDLALTESELQNLDRPATTKDEILSAYNKFKMSGTCGRFFVKEYPAGSFSALMLADLVDKFRVERNLKFDAIFIDYLGIMKSDLMTPNAGLYSYVKSIGEEVRAQAVNLGVPIISASQLNRIAVNKVEGVDNSAVSDSYGTTATADLMVFLLQTEEMKSKSEIVVKFTKNRYTGMTDLFTMNIDYDHMRFSDVVDGLDFKTVTDKEKAETFTKTEIQQVHRDDVEKAKKFDSASSGGDKMSMDDILKML
jgi:replicative DNA helicase